MVRKKQSREQTCARQRFNWLGFDLLGFFFRPMLVQSQAVLRLFFLLWARGRACLTCFNFLFFQQVTTYVTSPLSWVLFIG
jgi:hypothetical protein